MFRTRTWFALMAATITFGHLAPVEQGNGATLLYLLTLGTLIIYNPLRNNKNNRKEETR